MILTSNNTPPSPTPHRSLAASCRLMIEWSRIDSGLRRTLLDMVDEIVASCGCNHRIERVELRAFLEDSVWSMRPWPKAIDDLWTGLNKRIERDMTESSVTNRIPLLGGSSPAPESQLTVTSDYGTLKDEPGAIPASIESLIGYTVPANMSISHLKRACPWCGKIQDPFRYESKLMELGAACCPEATAFEAQEAGLFVCYDCGRMMDKDKKHNCPVTHLVAKCPSCGKVMDSSGQCYCRAGPSRGMLADSR